MRTNSFSCQRISVLILGSIFGLFCDATAPFAARAAAPVDQVVVVFKTHVDIGYTDMAANVITRYRTTMIDQALAVCDENKDLPAAQQFVWTIPGWPMQKIAEDWAGQTPERKQKIEQAFKQGRFVVHALPFTTHTELLEAEDLVRGLGFAARLSRGWGLPLPRDAKMTDVPCHSWIMPTLLRHAGVEFLHLGCNAACSSPQVPPLFWWEGPDGSRLLTMYTAEGYGTGLVPPADWKYRTWLALIHTGDNHGPPSPGEVKDVLDQAREKLPGVKVRIGRLSDFADGILAEHAELPVVRGDMPDTWIHGPMCDPVGAKLARTVRPALVAAEALHTQLDLWGVPGPDVSATIAAAYERSLLYGEHTWGGALAWITSYTGNRTFHYGDVWRAERAQGRFQRLEASWREHTAYIEHARDLVTPVLDADLRTLAQSVRVAGRRIVVFNPLAWPRDGIVAVPAGDAAVTALRAADSDDVVPVEVHEGTLRFVAKQVPSLGYRTYVPVPAAGPAALLRTDHQAGTIENAFFRATVDPARGAVRSLVDKRSGRELIDGEAADGFGQYLYERFDADNVKTFVDAYLKTRPDWALNELGKPNLPTAEQTPYRAVRANNCRLTFAETPVSVAAVMTTPPETELPQAVTTKLILYADQPYADLEVTLHDKPADPWPEAGWICLPCKVDAPRFQLGRLGSIIDPATDVVRGTNRHLFGVSGGVAIADSHGDGVGLCSHDSPLVSLDTPGCWKYSLDFVPQKPIAYINLFNNQWTTNFRYWNEGTWTARVRVWAIRGYDAESSFATPAAETRAPLVAAAADGPAGTLAPTQSGLHLSRPGVAVTAWGPPSDRPGTLLRLWEQAGRSGLLTVSLPPSCSATKAMPIDLRGEPAGDALQIRDGRFEFKLAAFAPASFRLE